MPGFRGRGRDRRDEEKKHARWQRQLSRLASLGVYPDALCGRLRLVMTIGCYGDFRFTRDILSTGAARENTDLAIDALEDLGAACDCQVLEALGQLPRGLLWHHSDNPHAT
ncbi:MAG: DUF2695 domain-containing protein [Chloroflexota bacterium]|nr:DUF2695 domain-containing protein [Chloroflexota bacterium]